MSGESGLQVSSGHFIDSFEFQVFLKPGQRGEDVQEAISEIEIGDVEWNSMDVKKDKSKMWINASGYGSVKLLKKVAMRLSSLPGVDKVKLVSGAPTPSAKTKAVKDKCTTQVLLDDSAVETLNLSIDYAMGQLRMLRGSLATAKEGNIRGRLHMIFSNELMVGSSYCVSGYVRYHEEKWPLTDATSLTWFASRAGQMPIQVATGPEYTPVVEDAGKRVELLVNYKGSCVKYDMDCVRVSQELEDSINLMLKKKKSLKKELQGISDIDPEIMSQAKRNGTLAVQVSKKGIQLSKGGRSVLSNEFGPDAFISSVRGQPKTAVLHIDGKEITLTFVSTEDCVEFVMAARAYSAFDKLQMICSLPSVDKEEHPNVSIINAIIQAGSVIEPYTWGAVPDVESELPEINNSDIQTILGAAKLLVKDRRIKASAYAVLMGALSAASQGEIPLSLPRSEMWMEPESEEEPESEPEPEPEPEPESKPEPGTESGQGDGDEVKERVLKAQGKEWSLSEEKYKSYKDLFMKYSTNNEFPKNKALEIFEKSGLDRDLMKQTIKLVAGNPSSFSLAQFVVILHMMQLLKKDKTLPEVLPDELATVLGNEAAKSPVKSPKSAKTPKSPKKPQKVSWEIDNAEVGKLKGMYNKLSEGKPEITLVTAAKMFEKSSVNRKDIMAIVILVCNGKKNSLNEKQFIACMLMLQGVKKGADVPEELPAAYEEFLSGAKKSREKKSSPKSARDEDEDEDEDEEEDDTWELDKQTYSRLKKMFRAKTEDEDTMTPSVAMKEFRKAGVDDQDMKDVMKLVLRGHKGAISEGQFVAVMFMLKQVRGGAEVPSSLPASLKKVL